MKSSYAHSELALFARYVEQRARLRPAQCHYSDSCWVTEGPPAMTNSGVCVGCGDKPLDVTSGAGGRPSGGVTRVYMPRSFK